MKQGLRLTLRRIDGDDAGVLFRIRNTSSVYMWCRQFAPLHWRNHLKWMEWQAGDKNTEMFAIEDEDCALIGACGLTSIDYVNRRAEFSLYIDPQHQGSGYGEEALRLLLGFGFRDLNLNRIWGETFEGNPAAKMFEKIGFELEGRRKEFYYRDGSYIDAHLYSISHTAFNHLGTPKA